jgi:hypothetical protein
MAGTQEALTMNAVIFIDIEASSLSSASYPIEVAWSDPAGGAPHAYLINPCHMDGWTDWSLAAQAIHHLSREQLRVEGVDPATVARALETDLAGKTVYCDAPEFDRAWLDALFTAVGRNRPFKLQDSALVWDEMLDAIAHRLGPTPMAVAKRRNQMIEVAKIRGRVAAGGQHRAAIDVKYLEATRSALAHAIREVVRRADDQQ